MALDDRLGAFDDSSKIWEKYSERLSHFLRRMGYEKSRSKSMEINKRSFLCRVFLSQVGWQDQQGIGESHKNYNKLKQSVNIKRSKIHTRNHSSGIRVIHIGFCYGKP